MEKELKEPTDTPKSKPASADKEVNQKPEEPSDTDKGVTVSEEFQKKAHELIHKASKHELKHVHDRAYSREDELRKAEEMKNKKESPDEFSMAEAPSSM